MEGTPHPTPRTVAGVYNDFKGRRAGLIKALTIEKGNLCLYGFPNETWEVLSEDEVAPELPEPALGINLARDEMEKSDWLSFVAIQSDSWLISVAFYLGDRFGFGKSEMKMVFEMNNQLTTVFEFVTGKQAPTRNNSSKNKASGGILPSRQPEPEPMPSGKISPAPKDEDEGGEAKEQA